MTEQEIEILESARFWILAYGRDNSDNKATRDDAEKLANALDDLIRKHTDVPHVH